MPIKLVRIREFARRLECSPSYISKLLSYGIIRKSPEGKIDPVSAVKDMRLYRDPVRESNLNLSGYCQDCGKEQNSAEIGAWYCERCHLEILGTANY